MMVIITMTIIILEQEITQETIIQVEAEIQEIMETLEVPINLMEDKMEIRAQENLQQFYHKQD